MLEARSEAELSVRRLARAFDEPVSTVGRWICCRESPAPKPRRCPVSGNPKLRMKVRALCDEPRHLTFGHRRIRALLRRRWDIRINRKTILKIMREESLTRPRVCHRPYRPKRVEKMRPEAPNTAWQIDMTSFQLSDLSPLFLVVVVDCFTREIVGWTLDRRCRALEWVSAVRMALEGRALAGKEQRSQLTLRSDNGAQPCSNRFAKYLKTMSVTGQYTGYSAPDDNAYVERVIRTVKEEEVWLNLYDTFTEAHAAIAEFVRYYNEERIHEALEYSTPKEAAAAYVTPVAA